MAAAPPPAPLQQQPQRQQQQPQQSPFAPQYPPPVAAQPVAAANSNVVVASSGLQVLAQLDRVTIEETFDRGITLSSKNKYAVKLETGQVIMKAEDDADACCSSNNFDMEIRDGTGKEQIHLTMPPEFMSCTETMEVYAPPGKMAGTVVKEWTMFFSPTTFSLRRATDPADAATFTIRGPGFGDCKFCSDVEYNIFGSDGTTEVGQIAKKYHTAPTSGSGMTAQYGNVFTVQFPAGADADSKALVLAAAFFIERNYKQSDNSNDDGGDWD